MKSEYKREDLKITKFDAEDVITTSGMPEQPFSVLYEKENAYHNIYKFGKPGSWF